MHRLKVLIHQERPAHQIYLHQACNAQGVFNVQVTEDLASARKRVMKGTPADLLILDHAMSTSHGMALLDDIVQGQRTRALLFVGQPRRNAPNLAREARARTLWVLSELAWPLSAWDLHKQLRALRRGCCVPAQPSIETVIRYAHAH
ncbi:response regulator [Pseudomonas capeferrum]|uniref:response regulator n=1 Tax=Pseudomonas capeferrum TaxID=1495066 RepID=UPI0015E39947|nr:response regulator [Pseudomonas capeferrum]MBA1203725.1 response regulator [Pseudomonas capeferrum]